MNQPDVGTDYRVVTDGCVTTQNGSAGVDNHPVADVGVPFDSLYQIAIFVAGKTECTEGYSLIELYPLTDIAGLTDHHPGAVIDEEALPDLRPRVNIYASTAVGVFAHDPGNQDQPHFVELMG